MDATDPDTDARTSPEHPDAVLIREFVEMLDRSDYEGIAERIADDVTWHYVGGPAPIRGKPTLLRAFQAEDGADWSSRIEIHDVTVGDGHVVALLRVRTTRGDRTLDTESAEIYHVTDGKVTAHWAFVPDSARILAFFEAPLERGS